MVFIHSTHKSTGDTRKKLPPLKHILALPTWGQKCTVTELQPFQFAIFQMEHPVDTLLKSFSMPSSTHVSSPMIDKKKFHKKDLAPLGNKGLGKIVEESPDDKGVDNYFRITSESIGSMISTLTQWKGSIDREK